MWFIIGGSSGIGYAVAKQMIQRGASVTLFSRRENMLRVASEELRPLLGDERQRVNYFPLDVTDRRACVDTLAKAATISGRLDGVVNCAGDVIPGYFEQLTNDDLRAMVDINIYGAWNVAQAVVAHLRESRGHLVSVSSMQGLIGTFGYSAYAATKFALVGMSEALRNEWAESGVSVSVVCPSDTDTPQLRTENKRRPPETAALGDSFPLLSADTVARAIIRGIVRRRFLIIVGWINKISFFIKSLFPRICYLVVDKSSRSVKK